MAILLAFPILGILVVLQSSLVSRVPLLLGTPDLMLLVIAAWALQKRVETAWQWTVIGGILATLSSALPLGVAFAGYGMATGLALLLRRRIWQAPVLAMFLVVFAGTLVFHALSILALRLVGNPIPLLDALNLVTLPSLLLNLLLAAPAFYLIADLASWLYPVEVEV
jgi:rod shape-determining protein MreD